ncbi:hypothetical protein vseg_018730 [Gypsophila vaccaria]
MQAPAPAPSSRLKLATSGVELSPPLIVMLVVAAFAFLLVTYSDFISRRVLPPLRRAILRYHVWRRRPLFPLSAMGSPGPPVFESSDGFFLYSPYGLGLELGLDESVIKNIPLSIFKPCKLELLDVDCAVCLIDFEDGDYMRTLPHCCHSFHVDCIDAWLRSHATCPLCRTAVLFPPTPMPMPMPMTPLMASRVRPSLEQGILLEDFLSEDHRGLLKRSYSFSLATTPRRSTWMKRPASIAKALRKSPGLMGRRNRGAMTEWTGRRRYMGMGKRGCYTSSRMRMGDPEALISPERVRRHLLNY